MDWLKTLVGEEQYNLIAGKLEGKILPNNGEYITKTKFNEINQAKKTYEAKISDYETQLKNTSEMLKNNEELKTQFEKSKNELTEMLGKKDKEITNIYKKTDLEKALKAKGAIYPELIIPLIDLDSVEYKDNKVNIELDDYVKKYPNAFTKTNVEGANTQRGTQVNEFTQMEQQLETAKKTGDIVSQIAIMEQMHKMRNQK